MKTRVVRLGTRGSALARWQTEHISGLLREAWPDLGFEIIVITTQGDKVIDTPLPLMGGKGVFTTELETALRNGEIDLAVHSLKDLPTDDTPGLTIGAIPKRADPRDLGATAHSAPRPAPARHSWQCRYASPQGVGC